MRLHHERQHGKNSIDTNEPFPVRHEFLSVVLGPASVNRFCLFSFLHWVVCDCGLPLRLGVLQRGSHNLSTRHQEWAAWTNRKKARGI